ncbi:phage major capsid protein [Ileibacterium valens]|uniref:phage major capsid protein n=1 Tax=Ileibacterium valens TaxID=1862668 RepID=UPI00235343A8|nr:phage major capsid protein [Ileibacterium valens]
MNKIFDMIEKRSKAWEAAKAFAQTKADADGLLSAEDSKTYKEMEAKIQNYSEEIERLQKMEAIEKELAKPVNKPLVTSPMNESDEKEQKTGRASAAYKKAMLNAIRCQFRQISNVLQEGVKEDGGYLVPEEYDSRLIDILNEQNVMRQLGTNITTSGEHKINVAATKPAAAWIEEGGTIQFEDATFSQIILDAHKLHVGVKVTSELLNDAAFDLESYLMNEFGNALANAEEDAFLNGTGNGQPVGIFAAKGGAPVEKTLTADITGDDLVDLVYCLKRPYRKNAAFLLNDATIAAIRKLKAEGDKEYIWQPSYQQGEPDRLLGYPVYTSPYAPADAIAFGDFSYYNIGDRGQRTFQDLRELFAGNDMVGFLAKERVDGKLVLPEAVKILKLKAPTKAAAKTNTTPATPKA